MDLDARWKPLSGEGQVVLRVFGSAALFMQTNYVRGTKDGDVLETHELDSSMRERLRDLAGPDSEMYRRHKLYLDIVGPHIPMLPPNPLWHPTEYRLEHFDVRVLDIADVLISKLKRFSGSDRDDIRAMIERGYVEHGRMLERMRAVVHRYEFDARADHLPEMVQRFHQLETDWFGLDEESHIGLPKSALR